MAPPPPLLEVASEYHEAGWHPLELPAERQERHRPTAAPGSRGST